MLRENKFYVVDRRDKSTKAAQTQVLPCAW